MNLPNAKIGVDWLPFLSGTQSGWYKCGVPWMSLFPFSSRCVLHGCCCLFFSLSPLRPSPLALSDVVFFKSLVSSQKKHGKMEEGKKTPFFCMDSSKTRFIDSSPLSLSPSFSRKALTKENTMFLFILTLLLYKRFCFISLFLLWNMERTSFFTFLYTLNTLVNFTSWTSLWHGTFHSFSWDFLNIIPCIYVFLFLLFHWIVSPFTIYYYCSCLFLSLSLSFCHCFSESAIILYLLPHSPHPKISFFCT